jgi:hypothetical protein
MLLWIAKVGISALGLQLLLLLWMRHTAKGNRRGP